MVMCIGVCHKIFLLYQYGMFDWCNFFCPVWTFCCLCLAEDRQLPEGLLIHGSGAVIGKGP